MTIAKIPIAKIVLFNKINKIAIIKKTIEVIKKSAYSGKIGDGKIFISNIDEVIRIRTGEKGKDAI